MRVLLATDSPDFGHALTLFLGERSIHVLDVTGDADDLVRRTAQGRPDVVLLDWRLGESVSTRLVADLMGGDDPTPVIVLSSVQQRARADACGATACATLGDHPDALLAMLDEIGGATD